MSRIKLRSVLAEIDTPDRQGNARQFAIRYTKADGSEGFKSRARKAGNMGGAAVKPGSGKFRYNVKERGVLVIVDCETNETRSLKISRLTHYNGILIDHSAA